MKLKNVQITKFRCIDDSTSFRIGDVTCLVGKNESGKTSVLHALERLKPLGDGTKFEKLRDYPRHLLTDFDKEQCVIKTQWELSDSDVAAVEAVLGPQCLVSREVVITKDYANERSYEFELDEKKIINWLLEEVAFNATERKQFSSCGTTQELKAKAEALDSSPRLVALLDRLKKLRKGDADLAATDVLDELLPHFLYFGSYDQMTGCVHLETLARNQTNDKLSRSEEVYLAFLEYAGTSLDEIRALNTYEAIKARVEAASIKISKQIFAFWSQNRHLKVEFSVEPGRAGDEPPFNSGTVMRTRIHNKIHDMTVPFDDRSAGFTWFFSFLALFSQVQKSFGDVVILLDEPGLNLHGKAQADLVRYVYEKLRDKHQVIYTTHSPFMVPSHDLAAVRTVEDVVIRKADDEVEVLGTKVGDEILSTDKDTLFPLQGALGYEITQTLFIGKHTLVVEGPSDILFIQAVSTELKRRGHVHLDSRWTLCPSGGIDKVAAFVSLFAGNNLHVAVLTDIAQGQKTKIESLRRSEVLRNSHLLTVGDFCAQPEADIEDLFGQTVYLRLINQSMNITPALVDKDIQTTGETSSRIVKKVEAMFRIKPALPEFDHYLPAIWLLKNPEFLAGKEPEQLEALKRFEDLFKRLNALLPTL